MTPVETIPEWGVVIKENDGGGNPTIMYCKIFCNPQQSKNNNNIK
jgi:hypothetical protein